ncbi:MurR/RpiR family transcriptional regulator [Pseudactinotalea sp. Z1732]|uniref:MurR/RpiR family transcriptional regulator n=1 Tax=Pseudactinotalea sp. Z1732 TaxID=3413026 RepID=UPI003C7A6B39
MNTGPQVPGLGSVPGRIRAGMAMLHPSELRVAEVIASRPEWAIEASAQEVADAAGTSRATVVRTAQRLGFTGYPQLRVLLARDVGAMSPLGRRWDEGDAGPAGKVGGPAGADPAAGSFALPGPAGPDDAIGLVREYLAQVRTAVEHLPSLLPEADLVRAVDLLHRARSVLVVGTGLSEPIALEAALRLNATGILVEAPPDRVLRGTRARALTEADVCLAISGSGSTRDTLQPARAAAAAGASVIALTATTPSPLGDVATVALVASMGVSASLGTGTFAEEITRTPRLPQTIVVNALVHALIARDPQRAQEAQNRMLEVIGDAFAQDPL